MTARKSLINDWIPSKLEDDSKKIWLNKKRVSFPDEDTCVENTSVEVWESSFLKESVLYYYVYILASKRNGTLYIGVTNDLKRRVYEHKEGLVKGFTKKYTIKNLVYYEIFEDIYEAIKREKKLKKFSRKEKLELIEKENRLWNDLYEGLF